MEQEVPGVMMWREVEREALIAPIYVVGINSRVLYLASRRRHILAAKSSIQYDIPAETQRMKTSKARFELLTPMV
jgi:hypothetical protein